MSLLYLELLISILDKHLLLGLLTHVLVVLDNYYLDDEGFGISR